MLTALGLVAAAAGILISVGTLVKLWIDSRKQDNKGDDDRSPTHAEYRRHG
jgi:hypothetical protein